MTLRKTSSKLSWKKNYRENS